MKQNQKTFLATVAILALPSFMLWDSYFSPTTPAPAEFEDVDFELAEVHPNGRFLRAEPQTIPRREVPRNLTIHLTETSVAYNIVYSFLKTGMLKRYGSGRVNYFIQEFAQCSSECNLDDASSSQLALGSPSASVPTQPCLAVSPGECTVSDLRCNFPTCKTMLVVDELCESRGAFDFRLYYSELIPGGHLPLGPRFDAWESMQKIHQSHPEMEDLPASKRKYAFNAIFSQGTNKGRKHLSKMIRKAEEESSSQLLQLPTYTSMASGWTRNVNSPKNDHLDTDHYIQAALDSIFTLSPAGHNPECYRMYEAAEAGSIPVFIRDDLYITEDQPHPCRNALSHWHDAPILVLESWDDLYPTMEKVLEDPAALDEMQTKFRVWYHEYMSKVVVEFENYMLEESQSSSQGSVAM